MTSEKTSEKMEKRWSDNPSATLPRLREGSRYTLRGVDGQLSYTDWIRTHIPVTTIFDSESRWSKLRGYEIGAESPSTPARRDASRKWPHILRSKRSLISDVHGGAMDLGIVSDEGRVVGRRRHRNPEFRDRRVRKYQERVPDQIIEVHGVSLGVQTVGE